MHGDDNGKTLVRVRTDSVGYKTYMLWRILFEEEIRSDCDRWRGSSASEQVETLPARQCASQTVCSTVEQLSR